LDLQRLLRTSKGLTVDTAHIDRGLFGLSLTAPHNHPAVPLIRKLPREYWILASDKSAPQQNYIIALVAGILPTLRRVYRLPDVTFTPVAVEALATLSNRQRAMDIATASVQRGNLLQRVDVTPDVSPSLRALDASTDPFVSGVNGASTPPTSMAPSSEEPTEH
jgi:hypothetical protein